MHCNPTHPKGFWSVPLNVFFLAGPSQYLESSCNLFLLKKESHNLEYDLAVVKRRNDAPLSRIFCGQLAQVAVPVTFTFFQAKTKILLIPET